MRDASGSHELAEGGRRRGQDRRGGVLATDAAGEVVQADQHPPKVVGQRIPPGLPHSNCISCDRDSWSR